MCDSVLLRFARVLGIGLILFGAVWLGETLGPRHVDADVYRTVQVRIDSVAQLLQGDQHPGGPRILFINGQRVHADIRRIKGSPQEVLAELDVYLDSTNSAKSAKADDGISAEEQVTHSVAKALRRPFRLEGPGWAALGHLVGKGGSADDEVLNAIANLDPGGSTESIFKNGFFVFALAVEPEQASDVWTLRFGPRFDPLAMLGVQGGDAPGADLPDIDRFPGSRRIFTLAELSAFAEAHIQVFEGSGTVAEHARYFNDLFSRLGFRVLRSAQSVASDSARAQGSYSGKGHEITVYITNQGNMAGRVLDVIQVRLPAREV